MLFVYSILTRIFECYVFRALDTDGFCQ